MHVTYKPAKIKLAKIWIKLYIQQWKNEKPKPGIYIIGIYSWVYKNPHKKQDGVAHTCNPIIQEAPINPWELLVSQYSKDCSSRFNERPCDEETKQRTNKEAT